MIDPFTSFLGTDLSYALGWTIIHSLWQVSLLALIMSGIHKIYRHKPSEFKYNVSLSSILLSLLFSVVTFIIYYLDVSSTAAAETIVSTTFSNTAINKSSTSILENINNAFTNNLHHISTIWIVGIMLFSLNFVLSFGYIKYIKSTATEILDPTIQKLLANTKISIGIKKTVLFVESTKINVPMVLGHVKPIILFPIGMINMLAIEETEAIIAHELFHIKRNDYIVNMVLTIIEIVYFFHPAMWWISANIKAERENCCDDAAINYNIDSVTYAKVLVKLEEMRHAGIPSLAMPFASNKHQLLNRIKRILNMEQTKNDIREKSVATVLLLFVAMLFASNVDSQLPQNEMSKTFSENSQIENEWTDDSPDLKRTVDSIRITGSDEIVVEVAKGLFSSLKVDGEEIEGGEMLNHLKKTFSLENLKENNIYNQKFYMKGNPMLEFKNQSLMFFGDTSHIQLEDEKRFSLKVDTLPFEMNLDNDVVTIITEKNGKSIELTKNNGQIANLKVDGKVIPESEFPKYQDDIDAALEGFTFDMSNGFGDMQIEMGNIFDGKSIDSIFSNSFGMMFDGENWRELGGNIEQLLDNDVFEKMEDMEHFRMFDSKDLENLEGLKEIEDLEKALEKMGIQLDSSMKMFNLDMDGFEGFNNFKGFDGFEFFNDDNIHIKDNEELFRSNTVVDKIGAALNRDGLLKEYKSNKIELSGKHLKINGEKMPKALFNKYKNIYQETTGAPLTKRSKMIFDVEGKPSKRKVRTF
ncbi:MAG: beta-lactamase regulating signal transducer with metallopeptidase domain [Saprospiraceae bacterium]|jgi:beta-lactamase regulating signal transducer with metallopeptidase domain|tara:strand:+ start:407 stop:2665 length:2259 start_codon:yes stop_codon:yes gene_type:complete